jgi:hypothetical protein
VIDLPAEPETQTYLEIRDLRSGGRVITVLEVLSPSNKKPGDAQEQYLRKQLELLEAGVSLVEIDLLRAGDWVVAVPREAVGRARRTPYRVAVRRGWQRTQVDYYPMRSTERLQTVQVPLRPTDAEAVLDLQPLLDQGYADGGYDDIDYSAEPAPPLSPTEARWAERLLRRAGLRPPRRRER